MISRFSDIQIDWRAMEVHRGDATVQIKPKAFQLLEYLFEHRDRVVSKDEIFEAVWQGRIVSDGALTTAVNDLRRALGDTGKDHEIIRTFYGQGLRFIGELGDEAAQSPIGAQTSPNGSGTKAAAPAAPLDGGSKTTIGLAVLPFENLSNDQGLGRMGEVIADELISALSRFSQLVVVSRASSFKAGRDGSSAQGIANALGVEYLVEGSLRPVENVVRLTAQLIDTTKDQHVWAGHLDLTIDGTPEDENEAIGVLTAQIIEQITRYEGLMARQVADEELSAWQNYYRGVSTTYTHKLDARDAAIGFFERALDLEPEFALARALLSFALNMPNVALTEEGYRPASPDIVRAGLERAEEEARLSLEQEPRYAYAWASLARTYTSLGRPEEGIGAALSAIELNPFLPVARYVLSQCYWSSGQLEEALDATDACIEVGPSGAFYWLSICAKACVLAALERHEEAVACSRDAQARSASSVYAFFGEICALGYLDRREEASDAIGRAERANPGFCLALFECLFPTSDEKVARYMQDGLIRAGLK